MPYATISQSTADVLVKTFSDLADEIKELEKDKTKKDQVKALKKTLEEKGKKIDAVLVKLIADVRKEFLKHAAKVDGWVGEARELLAGLKATAKDFAKNPEHDAYMEGVAVPKKIEAVAAAAQKDNDDFGGSWFKLRGHNFTSDGLDEKYNKNFYKDRFQLMGDAKTVVAKIKQIEDYQAEAVILANDLRSAFASGEQDKQAFLEGCQEFLEKVKKAHAFYENKTRDAGGAERVRAAVQEEETSAGLDGVLGNIRARTQDYIAIHKETLNQGKLLQKEHEQLRKFAKNPLLAAVKAMQDAAKLIADFAAFAKSAADVSQGFAVVHKEATTKMDKLKKQKK